MTAFRRDQAPKIPDRRNRQGNIFWFPAGATWLNQNKSRPFALAANVDDPAPATLVYGSTQRTESGAGAISIAVPPIRDGLNRNGLYSTTHFYPAALALLDAGALPAPAGYLGRSLPTLRTALRTALGIERGSCLGSASPAGSRRGRLVVLARPVAGQLGSSLAVILTEPAYSREKRYQIIVPILPEPRGQPGKYDLSVSERTWFGAFNRPAKSALIPTNLTVSIWHVQAITRETPYVIDDDTLAAVDRRLCDYFSLAPPDPHDGE